VRVRVYHVWLFNLSEATTGPHKANADIQCACITSHSSFCPGQRQTSQGQREHSVCVRDTAAWTETTVLFILSKTATGLSGSTLTFPCVCARPHTYTATYFGRTTIFRQKYIIICGVAETHRTMTKKQQNTHQ
jgi:hypothetical protein